MLFMRIPKERLVIAGILVLSFAVSILAWPSMPDPMASHWGFSGEVDGYMEKTWGLFLVPVISAALALLLLFIPRIDPLRENIESFRVTYDHFIIVLLLFLLYLQLLVILWNLGMRFSITQVLSPAFAVLFYSCGILIGKARMNWFIGIRTPWTLSSERVWERTHALGGKLFRAAGVAALGGILFPDIAWLLMLGPVLLFTGYLVVYSYIEYQREAKERPAGV